MVWGRKVNYNDKMPSTDAPKRNFEAQAKVAAKRKPKLSPTNAKLAARTGGKKASFKSK